MTNHIAYRLHLVLVFVTIAVTIFIISSCSGNPKVAGLLSAAENLIEQSPDSAFKLLKEIDGTSLNSKEEKARYALLMSMALDKNFIDTTSFDVLQPAIDYYLENGSPDEKLKMYYYQGRIYQNRGDLDKALDSFVNGLNRVQDCHDSIIIARSLIVQALLFREFYDFKSYTDNYLKAADIYNKLSLKDKELDCLLNALNGAILTENKVLGDSVLNLCNEFKEIDDTQRRTLANFRLSHAIEFGTIEEINGLINMQERYAPLDNNQLLTLAYAYHKVKKNIEAKPILDSIGNSGDEYDTLKYKAISCAVMEDLGNYKDALMAYKDFSHRMDSIDFVKFDQKALSLNERHRIELKAQRDIQEKDEIIWGCVAVLVILALGVVILFLLLRNNRQQKHLAIQKAKNIELENNMLKSEREIDKLKSLQEKTLHKAKITEMENERLKTEQENDRLRASRELALHKARITELENENLKKENDMALQKARITELENEKLKRNSDNLILENKNLQLEMEKKALEAENLAHQVEHLENERDCLKDLLDASDKISPEAREAIRMRVEMLNSLLASYIADNDQYKIPYDTWVKEIKVSTEEFMNSNRLAFQASHPQFIQYFEDHGLTVDEINYVCLYATGLKGKDVGGYIKKRSHVNISSAIRKKLGIDKYETNIGIYVRKLLKRLYPSGPRPVV